MTQEFFGTTEAGNKVYRFCLISISGLEAHMLTYGRIIQKLLIPQKNGKTLDVVLDFNEIAQYEAENPYFGRIIGRK